MGIWAETSTVNTQVLVKGFSTHIAKCMLQYSHDPAHMIHLLSGSEFDLCSLRSLSGIFTGYLNVLYSIITIT